MANWLLNDSAPVTVGQQFDAAATAKAWGWFGMPAGGEGSQFEAAPAPWSRTYWTPAELAYVANTRYAVGVGGSITPTGALTSRVMFRRTLTGSITMTGTVARLFTAGAPALINATVRHLRRLVSRR